MTPAHPIEKWYTGKALELIRSFVLPTLAAAEERGHWAPGESRKVVAALNKQAVARRFADANNIMLCSVSDNRRELYGDKLRGWDLAHAMRFGAVSHAPACLELSAALAPLCLDEDERAAVTAARGWAGDFTPVAQLVARLDATRPIPVIILGSLSRTVAGNVGKVMGIDLAGIRLPHIEWVRVRFEVEGKEGWYHEAVVRWPENTHHNTSRFAHGPSHCHACGHAIKDPFNWVPLLGDTPTGPASLWVGRDCARKLFAVDMKGEAQFARPIGPSPEGTS